MLAKIEHTYCHKVAFYLTWDCNLSCSYCLNRQGLTRFLPKGRQMKPEHWIRAANRFSLPGGAPIILQGGEPTLYPGMGRIIRESDPVISFEIKTNLNLDPEKFIANIPFHRLGGEGIIASYHPEQMRAQDLIPKISTLVDHGFVLSLYAIWHPRIASKLRLLVDREIFRKGLGGVRLKFKPFVGFYRGKLYGRIYYPGAVDGTGGERVNPVRCRTSEILVAPDGKVHRCYTSLFGGWAPIAGILDEGFSEETIKLWRECGQYGQCSPCDIKEKYVAGWGFMGCSSAEIRNI